MAELRWQVRAAVVPVSMAVLFFSGCAKEPATPVALAPGSGASGTGIGSSDEAGQDGGGSARVGAGDVSVIEGARRGAGQAGRGAAQVPGEWTSKAGAGAGAGQTARNGGRSAASAAGAIAAAGGAQEGGAQSRAAMLAAARPEVREFATVAEVRDIHFDFDRYEIRPDDAMTLSSNAEWFRAHPRDLILVEGHCDSRGTNDYNLALGQHRADAAMKYLVAHGVSASRITTISYGEERPVCTEENEGCWARNRRAHFQVSPR